jgi:hypothetical protein
MEAAIFPQAAKGKLEVPYQNIQVMFSASIAALFLEALEATKFQVGLPPCLCRRHSASDVGVDLLLQVKA